MLKRHLINALIIAGIISFSVACKTKKTIITEKPGEKPVPPLELSVLETRWEKDYTTLKLKRIDGKVIINGISDNVRGNMAVYRDSLIVVSVVPAAGYEVLRIMYMNISS